VSGIFSVAVGVLAAAAGVLLGALMLHLFLIVLRRAIRPLQSDLRSPRHLKRDLVRRAGFGVAVGNSYHRRPSTSVHH